MERDDAFWAWRNAAAMAEQRGEPGSVVGGAGAEQFAALLRAGVQTVPAGKTVSRCAESRMTGTSRLVSLVEKGSAIVVMPVVSGSFDFAPFDSLSGSLRGFAQDDGVFVCVTL